MALAATAAGPALRAAETPLVVSIDGALVSTGDLARQRAFFEGVFGLRTVAEQKLSAAEVKTLFGLEGRSATTALLETPGTKVGVRLVAFDPTPVTIIRDQTAGIDTDAIKVIDFTLEDWGTAVATLKAKGFDLIGPPAEYALPQEGRFTEGHIKGPDGVVAAFLKFHDSPRSRFVRVTQPLFSEIMGVSAPVSDLPATKAFYAALGLGVVFEYAIETDSFAKLIGAGKTSRMTGTNFGTGEKATPMIGVVHYGLPTGSYRSLKDLSVLPNRGTVALRLTVASVERVAEVCRKASYEIVAPPARVTLLPHGKIRSLLVRAPHGVLHHLIETA